jgi:hypothetical protein
MSFLVNYDNLAPFWPVKGCLGMTVDLGEIPVQRRNDNLLPHAGQLFEAKLLSNKQRNCRPAD